MILHMSLNELWYPVTQTSGRHGPDIYSWPYLKETVSHKQGGPDKLVKSGKLNKSKASLRKKKFYLWASASAPGYPALPDILFYRSDLHTSSTVVYDNFL